MTKKIVHDAFYEVKSSKTKCSFADIVTETDERIEKTLCSMIKQKYPSHQFIGEESTAEKVVLRDDPVWIIDPIDGTTNFVHKLVFQFAYLE